jgi:phosphopantothenoylcysteine decarboxylase/phosphopantothenate--cysteine ligase
MNVVDKKAERKLLIGASGAVTVLNLHMWIAHLKQHLFGEIRVIMTDTATEFVNPQIISSYTGTPTHTKELGSSPDFPAPHVSLTEWADVFLILPASANIIGKAANGVADDLLTSAILAAPCPVMFVPSMNMQMWNKPVVQHNIKRLEEFGYHVAAGPIQEAYRVSTGKYEESITIDISQIGIKLMRLLRK